MAEAPAAEVAALLTTKQRELEQELSALSAPTGEAGDISFGKRVGDGTSMAVERLSQVAAHDRLQVTLVEVRRAQEKLGGGSYGECDACGRRIGAERLEALPWATRCITCAAGP